MRDFLFCLAVLVGAARCFIAQAPARNQPLPNAAELLQRAIANQRKLAEQRERYECRVASQIAQTDKNGNVKKNTAEVKELFFVNGIPVERILSRNGKNLPPEEVKKEDGRVMKKTLKYSNLAEAKKERDEQVQQVEDLLDAMLLSNGRRETVGGRTVLFYDVVPNPSFRAKNLNQRFATVMEGKISIDEQTGEIIDFNVRSVADLKIGGGVVANLHKGFWLHIRNRAQPDGVWLTDLAEGSGDARAALFLHPHFQFKETSGDCHLYSATAEQADQIRPVK